MKGIGEEFCFTVQKRRTATSKLLGLRRQNQMKTKTKKEDERSGNFKKFNNFLENQNGSLSLRHGLRGDFEDGNSE